MDESNVPNELNDSKDNFSLSSIATNHTGKINNTATEPPRACYTQREKVSTIRYSPVFLQTLFGIQRIACVGIAIWDYSHTRDLTRFSLLLLSGQIDLFTARDFLFKAIIDAFAKALTKDISKSDTSN